MFRILILFPLIACENVANPFVDFDDSRVLDICELDAEDPFDIDGVSIEGDSLIVRVSYTGGCGSHEWQICWDGTTDDISPPQVYLDIGHNSNGDTCEAIRTETLTFDISSLQGSNPGVDSLTVYVGSEAISYSY